MNCDRRYSSAAALDGKESEVVEGRGVGEGSHVIETAGDEVGGRAVALLMDEAGDAVDTIFLARGRARLGEAVGIEEQRVACLQLQAGDGVFAFQKQAQGRAHGFNVLRTAREDGDGGTVAGVMDFNFSIGFGDATYEGGVLPGESAFTQDAVGLAAVSAVARRRGRPDAARQRGRNADEDAEVIPRP